LSRQSGCMEAGQRVVLDSDVDLALTVGTGQYVRLPMSGKKELSDALVLKVRLKQYNSPADHSVRHYCDEFSVVQFPK